MADEMTGNALSEITLYGSVYGFEMTLYHSRHDKMVLMSL